MAADAWKTIYHQDNDLYPFPSQRFVSSYIVAIQAFSPSKFPKLREWYSAENIRNVRQYVLQMCMVDTNCCLFADGLKTQCWVLSRPHEIHEVKWSGFLLLLYRTRTHRNRTPLPTQRREDGRSWWVMPTTCILGLVRDSLIVKVG